MKNSKKGVLVGKCSMITGGLVLGVVLVGGALSGSVVSADGDSVVDDVTITVPTACTMSGVVDSAHTTSMQAATYSGAGGIGKTTLSTHCNDNNGFSIYAVGFTNDTDGTNTLVGTTSSQTINTGIYTSGATDSSWSMKVSKVTDSSQSYNPQNMTITNSFDNWHLVPTAYTKVAEYHAATGSSTTDTVLGAKVETTYDAYISRTQTADTYTGKVKYVMVHPYDAEAPLSPQPSIAGCINYFANASDAVGTMGCQSQDDSGHNPVDGASFRLLASNFSRTGYGFAGWSDSFDYATNPNAKFYGPQETITVPTGTTANGLSLYAVWIKSQGNLQDQSKVASVCSSLTTAPTDGTANLSSVSALTDQRDNQTYAIAKLADGNCWMIENLRLESTAEHNSDGTLAQGYGISSTYGNFGGLADAESSNFSDSTTANSLYYSGTQEGTASIDIGTTNYPGYRMPRYNNWNSQSDSTNRPQNPTTNFASMYSYGNYYTWHAAIADLTYNGTNNQSTTGTSLCPAGWHLPTGGSAYASGSTKGINVTGDTSTFREFYNLVYKTMDEVKTAYEDMPNDGYAYYSSYTTNPAGKTATAALRSFPNNFLYSGFSGSSSAYNRGSGGAYWSSTANNNKNSYYLELFSSLVIPGTDRRNKSSGQSIRCTVGA